MAATCCFSPCIPTQKSGPAIRPFSRVLRLKHCQVSVKIKSSTLKIRCSLREEVFEDRSNGIICYKDDRGEIICEGFDEGPRYYHQQNPRTGCQPSSAETLRSLIYFNNKGGLILSQTQN
ncbi:uncharacterized protein LOC18784417 isoform X3 [Prunus persica]|uniref:uncharacterized protein LOC18784417 isoform X3 n=1 Tax=Prunus persica TaxID=3760 RepID=UPI0009AB67CE|nr:uncharacterized protein LOC18784417 isoform X3 [Prunus persica]XP_034206716.1 uncharacterized protein LOC117620679 isoform X2 [Prunus dulcis]